MATKIKKTQGINSDAYAFIAKMISDRVKIVDAYVEGKWLRAELSSGVRFSVRNTSL